MNWIEVEAKLREYYTLPDDWDGASALAPPELTIDQALLACKMFDEGDLDPPDRVVATVNGDINLEFAGEGTYEEITFTRGGVEFFADGKPRDEFLFTEEFFKLSEGARKVFKGGKA